MELCCSSSRRQSAKVTSWVTNGTIYVWCIMIRLLPRISFILFIRKARRENGLIFFFCWARQQMKVVITGESHCRTNLDVTERRLIPRRMISFEISAGRQFGDHDEMNWWHEMTLTLPLVADKTQMINASSCALTKKKVTITTISWAALIY